MALRLYEVHVQGGCKTTMQLSEADAKKFGAKPIEDKKKAPAPADKRRRVEDKQAD